MSYKIELTTNFKQEAKRLAKKYPSLKIELVELFVQPLALLLVTIFIKFDWRFYPKEKANLAVQGYCIF